MTPPNQSGAALASQPPNGQFSSCRYSAFLSYADADDRAWRGWISSFRKEFDFTLQSRVLGVSVPNSYFSPSSGDSSGALSKSLRESIALSFAMILFVHDGYLASSWCLKELKYFKELFGNAGFDERLYIVAMSMPAMQELKRNQLWRDNFSDLDDLIWMPFYQDEGDAKEHPIDIYTEDARQTDRIVSNAFWHRFVRLREGLAKKIKRQAEAERFRSTYPPTIAASGHTAPKDEHVRVYIEGNKGQYKYWETLGQQVTFVWDSVVAREQVEPPLYLRPTGLPLTELAERPLLDDANGVILLWDKKTPDSLAAQISQVEPKLSGPQPAPGLVAYMMQGVTDEPDSPTINNWPVVRFATRPDNSATVLSEDSHILATFLKRVLSHKRRT